MDKVPEGTTSYHPFSYLKKDGKTPVSSVERAEYKLSDGTADMVGWTDITALGTTGEIRIPGQANRILANGAKDRYLTLFVEHDGGDTLTVEIKYRITNFIGITEESPETT
ncbi:hypothetical protein [uncultured Desulfobacter sp.]|uniref:hypothetical protein n=1 Tax=uncultured Desulfobacter sp. TaxID=240139 RepID=UPI002AAAF0BB|nr:hypothetical protein [uncultured Desulfobacter sp.]